MQNHLENNFSHPVRCMTRDPRCDRNRRMPLDISPCAQDAGHSFGTMPDNLHWPAFLLRQAKNNPPWNTLTPSVLGKVQFAFFTIDLIKHNMKTLAMHIFLEMPEWHSLHLSKITITVIGRVRGSRNASNAASRYSKAKKISKALILPAQDIAANSSNKPVS